MAVMRTLYTVLTMDSHVEICKRSLLRIMPSIIDEERFEETLAQLLEERAKYHSRAYSNPPSTCTPSWFALLFGILACGVQLASSELQTDVRKARVLGMYPLKHCDEAILIRIFSLLFVSMFTI